MRYKGFLVSGLLLISTQLFAAECSVTVDSTDQMKFDKSVIEVDRACKTFTVVLTHSGKLPKMVMGHNWVLSKTSDSRAIVNDGMAAGANKDYLKQDDERVIAHTKVIGAGETDSVVFDVSKLSAADTYQFFCSFPGHIAMMTGSLKLLD